MTGLQQFYKSRKCPNCGTNSTISINFECEDENQTVKFFCDRCQWNTKDTYQNAFIN